MVFWIREGGTTTIRKKKSDIIGLTTMPLKTNAKNEEDVSSLALRIRNIERQILRGKLVLLEDDKEPLKPWTSVLDSGVESQEQVPVITE